MRGAPPACWLLARLPPMLGGSLPGRPAVTTDLSDHLQFTLGATYKLEPELRSGGMSRVFVATETSLGRRVVVKVLPPELAASVNVERFRREPNEHGPLPGGAGRVGGWPTGCQSQLHRHQWDMVQTHWSSEAPEGV